MQFSNKLILINILVGVFFVALVFPRSTFAQLVGDRTDNAINTFYYDAGGQRLGKVSSDAENTYYVSPSLEVVINTDGTMSYRRNYGFNGRVVAVREDSNVSYLHQDHLGSTSLVTNSSGAVTAQQVYYPYGETRTEDGNLPTEREYTGQVSDTDTTGLYYYNARYYNPTIAKFIQADTVNSDGLNRYMYVGNNPVNFIDPTGNIIDTGYGGGGLFGKSVDKNFKKDRFAKATTAFESVMSPPSVSSPSDYESDPLLDDEYSTWRELVAGAPCTGCHVTHTLTQDGIPTNSQIDTNLVDYYGSLDQISLQMHLAALNTVSYYSSLPERVEDRILKETLWQKELETYTKIANEAGGDIRVVSRRQAIKEMGIFEGLSTHGQFDPATNQVTIISNGNPENNLETLYHEYAHFSQNGINRPWSWNSYIWDEIDARRFVAMQTNMSTTAKATNRFGAWALENMSRLTNHQFVGKFYVSGFWPFP